MGNVNHSALLGEGGAFADAFKISGDQEWSHLSEFAVKIKVVEAFQIWSKKVMTPEHLEKLRDQAFAQIIWGDQKEDVIAFLVSNGVSPVEASEIVKQATKERAAEIRRIGIRDLLIGGLILAGSFAGAAIYWAISLVIYVKLMAIPVGFGIYGLLKLLKGLTQLIGGHAGGSISELNG